MTIRYAYNNEVLTSAVDVNDEEPVDTPVDPSNGP
jgi:hypothetical protein